MQGGKIMHGFIKNITQTPTELQNNYVSALPYFSYFIPMVSGRILMRLYVIYILHIFSYLIEVE